MFFIKSLQVVCEGDLASGLRTSVHVGLYVERDVVRCLDAHLRGSL